jgi:hypothetical protein
MEQILELMLDKMDSFQAKTDIEVETNQVRLNANTDSHHEEMMMIMKAGQGMITVNMVA